MEFMVSRFTTYQTICEELDTLNKIMDATECYHQMMDELGRNLPTEQMEWILGKRLFIVVRIVVRMTAPFRIQAAFIQETRVSRRCGDAYPAT